MRQKGQLRIADLYRQPRPPDMVADPVYSEFVSPYYRAEREWSERAERELYIKQQELAEQAQELACKEAEVAELKALLQQLGNK